MPPLAARKGVSALNTRPIASSLAAWLRRGVILGLLLAAGAAPAAADERGAAAELNQIRHQPARLNQFLWDLPKGGDLHMHLSGAVYAESMLRYGAAS